MLCFIFLHYNEPKKFDKDEIKLKLFSKNLKFLFSGIGEKTIKKGFSGFLLRQDGKIRTYKNRAIVKKIIINKEKSEKKDVYTLVTSISDQIYQGRQNLEMQRKGKMTSTINMATVIKNDLKKTRFSNLEVENRENWKNKIFQNIC